MGGKNIAWKGRERERRHKRKRMDTKIENRKERYDAHGPETKRKNQEKNPKKGKEGMKGKGWQRKSIIIMGKRQGE